MQSPVMKKKNPSRLSRSHSRQIRRLEIARPFGRSEPISPRSDLADKSQPSIFNLTAQNNPVVCISPSHFAPVRTSRSTRTIDLRSNGPHRSAVRLVRSSRPTRAIDLRSNGPHRPHTSASLIYSRLGSISQDESQPLIPNPAMRVFRKPLRKPTNKPLPEPFRSLTRVPEARPISLPEPTRSLAECLLPKLPPKPLPDRPSESATCPGSHLSESLRRKHLRNRPFGPSFGTRHVSRRLSRKSPSQNALCPRSPAESLPGSLLRSVLGTCHVFPSAERKPFPPGFFPNLPHVD